MQKREHADMGWKILKNAMFRILRIELLSGALIVYSLISVIKPREKAINQHWINWPLDLALCMLNLGR